jgi:hypothetical protein
MTPWSRSSASRNPRTRRRGQGHRDVDLVIIDSFYFMKGNCIRSRESNI